MTCISTQLEGLQRLKIKCFTNFEKIQYFGKYAEQEDNSKNKRASIHLYILLCIVFIALPLSQSQIYNSKTIKRS